ncbi:hypothetical protein VaNZ11_002325 [Volvox africanus]|uniref:Guanylate cyclase domain-containing protein n=1 Tax=Volvox africanus TaxID=51714 RepID=A0ABQ5RRZ2_9CHLO|nr:hypothetical protein VaNZ11_002325 [Volvox africanus]
MLLLLHGCQWRVLQALHHAVVLLCIYNINSASGHFCWYPTIRSYATCELPSGRSNVSQVLEPILPLAAGLRPCLPAYLALARDHSRRALLPGFDERLSVVLRFDPWAAAVVPPNSSLATTATVDHISVPSAVTNSNTVLTSDSRSSVPATTAAAAEPIAPGSARASEGAAAKTVSAAAAATVAAAAAAGIISVGPVEAAAVAAAEAAPEAAHAVAAIQDAPQPVLSVLGRMETAALPLLRSRNDTWLQQLNTAAAAGDPLPMQLLPAPTGRPGGPPAAPLLLFYRRDWWAALTAPPDVTALSTSDIRMANTSTAAAAPAAANAANSNATRVAGPPPIPLPPTWNLFSLLVADLVNRDLDGDGLPDHVLCIDMMPGCKGGALLAAIYAALAQANGTSQGLWFNPLDLSPLLGGPALVAAMQLYGALGAANAGPFTPGRRIPAGGGSLSFNGSSSNNNCSIGNGSLESAGGEFVSGSISSSSTVPVSVEELLAGGGEVDPASGAPVCGAINPLFAAGRCLFTVDWASAATWLEKGSSGIPPGALGVALLPGSERVQPIKDYNAAPTVSSSSDGGIVGSDSSAVLASNTTSTNASASSNGLLLCTATSCPYADAVNRTFLETVAIALNRNVLRPTNSTKNGYGYGPDSAASRQQSETGPYDSSALSLKYLREVRQMSDRLLVNRAPFLGENEDVWLLLPPAPLPISSQPLPPASSAPPLLLPSPLLQVAQQTRAAEFARLVSYQLYLKNGLITQLSVRQGIEGDPRAMADAAAPPPTNNDWNAAAYGNITVLGGVSQAVPPTGDVTAAAVASLLKMDPDDVMRVAKVVSSAVQHRNAAIDIQLPYSSEYRTVLDHLAEAAVAVRSNSNSGAGNGNGSSSSTRGAEAGSTGASGKTDAPPSQAPRREAVAEVAVTAPTSGDALMALQSWAVQEFANITQHFPYPAILIRIYAHTIGAVRPPRSSPGAPAQPPPVPPRRPFSHGIIVAIVAAVLAAVCLGVGLIWRFLRIRNEGLLQGSGRMPGAHPNTTLVVTDVQGSTTLWEMLSGDLMDEVLHIHHRVVRQAISQWKGYEVFTEGDAFAVVFHLPEDALDFAVGLQAAFLGADWPPELLEQSDCCEVWARRHSAQPPSSNCKRSLQADLMFPHGPPGGGSGVGMGPAPPSGPLAVSTPGGTRASTATGDRDDSTGGRPGRRILNVLSPFWRKSLESSSGLDLGLRPGWGVMGRFPKLPTAPGGGPTIPTIPSTSGALSFLNRGTTSASVPVLSPGAISGCNGAQYGTNVAGAISTGMNRWISTPLNNVSPVPPALLTRMQTAGTPMVSGANSRLYMSQSKALTATRAAMAPGEVTGTGATTRLPPPPYTQWSATDGTNSPVGAVGDVGRMISSAATAAAVAAAADAVMGSGGDGGGGGGGARAPDRTTRNRASRVVPYFSDTVWGGTGGPCYRSLGECGAVSDKTTTPNVAAIASPGAIATAATTVAIAASQQRVNSPKEDGEAVAGPLPRLPVGHLPPTQLQARRGSAASTDPPSQQLSSSYGAASQTEVVAEAGAGAGPLDVMGCAEDPGGKPREKTLVSEQPGPCVSSELRSLSGLVCDGGAGEAECRISAPASAAGPHKTPTQAFPTSEVPWIQKQFPLGLLPKGLPPWQLLTQRLQETQKQQPQLPSTEGSRECVRSQEPGSMSVPIDSSDFAYRKQNKLSKGDRSSSVFPCVCNGLISYPLLNKHHYHHYYYELSALAGSPRGDPSGALYRKSCGTAALMSRGNDGTDLLSQSYGNSCAAAGGGEDAEIRTGEETCTHSLTVSLDSDDGRSLTEPSGGGGGAAAIMNSLDVDTCMDPVGAASHSANPPKPRKSPPAPTGTQAAAATATAAVAVPFLVAGRIDGPPSGQHSVPKPGVAFGVRSVGAHGSDVRRLLHDFRDLGLGPPSTAAVVMEGGPAAALDDEGVGDAGDWRSCVAWDTSTSYNTFEGPDRETHCSGSTLSVARSTPPLPSALAPLSSPSAARAVATASTATATFRRPPPLKLLSSNRYSNYQVIGNNSQQQQEQHLLPAGSCPPVGRLCSPDQTGPRSYLLGFDRSYGATKARSPTTNRQSLPSSPSGVLSQAPVQDRRHVSVGRQGLPLVVTKRAGSAIAVDGWFSRRRRLLLQPAESPLRRTISAHRSLTAGGRLDADVSAFRRAAGGEEDGNFLAGVAFASGGTTSTQTAGGTIFGSGSPRPAPQAVVAMKQQQQDAGGRGLLQRLNASLHRMSTLSRISAGSAGLWASVSGIGASPTAAATSTAVATTDMDLPLSPSQPTDCGDTATAAGQDDHPAEEPPGGLLALFNGLELGIGQGAAAASMVTAIRSAAAAAAAAAPAADDENDDVPPATDAATKPDHVTVNMLTTCTGADSSAPCAAYNAADTCDIPHIDTVANGTEDATEATVSIATHGGPMVTPTTVSATCFRFMDPAAAALGPSTSRAAVNANSNTAAAANGMSTSLALMREHMLYHMGRSSRLLMLGQAAAAASSAPPVATSLAAGASRGSLFMDLLWRDINTAASGALGSGNTTANGGVIIGHASAAATPAADGTDISTNISGVASAPLQRRRPEGWGLRNAVTSVSTGAVGAAAGAVYTLASALKSIYEQVNTEGFLAHLGIVGTLGGVVGCGGSGIGSVAGPTGSLSTCIAEPQLVLRGLRLRVGLHSGPSQAEVVFLAHGGVAGVRYLGRFLSTSKDVCDAATGGMVLASGATFRAYQQRLQETREARGQRGGGGSKFDLLLIHLGEYLVGPAPAGGSAEDAEHCAVKVGRSCRPVTAVNISAGPNTDSTAAEDASMELYGVVCPWLVPRLAVLPSPVRGLRQVVPGCLSAPAGVVTPVFCNLLGVEALLAWEHVVQQRHLSAAMAAAAAAATVTATSAHRTSPEASSQIALVRPPGTYVGDGGCGAVVQEALELLRRAAMAAAACHGGYVVAVSADGGHWVLVFGSASSAVSWGLYMLDAMLEMPWPDGLLEHELTEEVYEGGALVKRGLRLRIGADRGCAMLRPVPRTGRLDYVGRPMNRAARIAAKAKAATMFVSGAVWDAARGYLERPVSASCLGLSQLKGVREQVELWALRPVSVAARSTPAAATTTTTATATIGGGCVDPAAGDSDETVATVVVGADAANFGRAGA